MTTKYTDPAPCWYTPIAGEDDREWILHYSTKAEALEDQDPEDLPPVQYERRCITLRCDACGLALGMDGEMDDHGQHIDPSHLNDWLSDDWMSLAGDVHYCPDCPHPDDEEDTSRQPGPNDIPLFETAGVPMNHQANQATDRPQDA